ncbi:Ca2+-binding EF-hand superfamily protein [Wenyingzhuangia heitensis]|uniref:Ca2+-binding EF-hand superfamily protein n=1 Tax=Wenyingzhuangia heitensis TaxID=1487859 RepID=A0ABX0UG88_9FLAO|nr:EF-hand domain-containing protein [Wenyingzhuangia heitensis]NIJ46421.1 Ca2+-binding EF-hand superfamily protein [Wenyingzhuangia heitensis]
MKSQKITVIASAICLFATVSAFSQEQKPKPSPEKMFKKFDTNKDGKITKEELEGKKIANRFDKIDKDGNGAISLEELTNSINKQGKGNGDKPKKAKPAHNHDEDDNDGGEE